MSDRKKIVYLIFTYSGLGGHYYSLLALANSLRFDYEISIINIGHYFSKVLKNQPFKTYFIKHQNIITSCILLKRMIEKLVPDVLHAFDRASLTLLKIIMKFQKRKYIHTLCGGPNPAYFYPFVYPFVKNLILFSQENYLFFKRKKNFIDSNIFLIPNRVFPIKTDSKRINMLLNELKFKFPIFLRICRISKFHIRSLIQSITLVEKLRKRGIEANLLIIGVPTDIDTLEFIKKHENNYLKIVTQKEYTMNANELIQIADFVIGTGRSFMEGAYFSKVMLVPQKNERIPLLIDRETFKTAFDVNLSERTRYRNYSEEINLTKIIQCINDEKLYKELAGFLKNKSNKYFEISRKNELYHEIYNNLEPDYINLRNFKLLREILTFISKIYLEDFLNWKF